VNRRVPGNLLFLLAFVVLLLVYARSLPPSVKLGEPLLIYLFSRAGAFTLFLVLVNFGYFLLADETMASKILGGLLLLGALLLFLSVLFISFPQY
jgi:hypothetical protein